MVCTGNCLRINKKIFKKILSGFSAFAGTVVQQVAFPSVHSEGAKMYSRLLGLRYVGNLVAPVGSFSH